MVKLQFNIFGYEFNFGRPKKNPDRRTEQSYFNFFPVKSKQTQKKPNSVSLRRFANTAIPRRAIKIIKDGVLSLSYEFKKVNPKDKNDYSRQIAMLNNIIRNPNNIDTYDSFWGALLEDEIVGDCGMGEIVPSGDIMKPIYLFPVDGFSMEYVEGWSGQSDYPRFAQQTGLFKKLYFYDNEILYLNKNTFTHVPWGLSPLETAFTYIDYLLNTQMYANIVAGKGMPKFLIDLGENVNANNIDAFRRYMENDIYGTGNIPVIGGTKGANAFQIGSINDDGLYLEWQHFLITIISLAFGIDPKKLGEGSATDRSTVDEQNDNIFHEAIKPYAKTIESAINKKILSRLGLDGVLEFAFVYEETLSQKKQKTDIVIAKFNANAITVDEMRVELGYLPIKGKYTNLIISEMKSAINKDYMPEQNLGGFNGIGKDRKEDKPKKGGEKIE